MAEGEPPGYQVSWLGPARQVVRTLRQRAVARGLLPQLALAVDRAERRLLSDPLSWGDPECRLRHLNLLKCHGTSPPLIVYFAVDEARRRVYVSDVKVFSGHPLAADED